MASLFKDNVDYRLLNGLSNLVICSHCLRSGKVTPVPQIITKSRAPTNLCADCRSAALPNRFRGRIGKLLQFPR